MYLPLKREGRPLQQYCFKYSCNSQNDFEFRFHLSRNARKQNTHRLRWDISMSVSFISQFQLVCTHVSVVLEEKCLCGLAQIFQEISKFKAPEEWQEPSSTLRTQIHCKIFIRVGELASGIFPPLCVCLFSLLEIFPAWSNIFQRLLQCGCITQIYYRLIKNEWTEKFLHNLSTEKCKHYIG